MPRIEKKCAGKFAKQIIQALQYQLSIFFSVYQSIATHMFEYFLRSHVFGYVSVDVAFLFKVGFW